MDIAITPQAIRGAVARKDFSLAINMALHLGETSSTREAVNAVPIDAIELVVKSVDVRMIKELLKFLALELVE